jgi:glycosyltransferase involved in cell wall biosynthesis
MRILWIPHAAWHISQRAHLFTHALAEQHELHVTVFGDYTSIKDYFSLDYLQNFFYSQRKDGRLHLHRVARISPALYFPIIRKLNNQFFQQTVERLILELKIDVVVGTFVCPMTENAPRVIFDFFDDNVSGWMQRSPSYAREIAEVETAYLQKADAVVCVSSVLMEKARQINPAADLYHIPNGIDLSRFSAADGSAYRREFAGKKLIGIVGNYSSARELDLLIDAVKLLNDENIHCLIAGMGSALAHAQKRILNEGLENISFWGYVPADKLADVLDALDVGLCPYLESQRNAASPMKVIAYSALGLPTVCTSTEELSRMNFSNVIITEVSAQAFADGIQQALKMPRQMPSQIKNYDIRRLTEQYQAVLKG